MSLNVLGGPEYSRGSADIKSVDKEAATSDLDVGREKRWSNLEEISKRQNGT